MQTPPHLKYMEEKTEDKVDNKEVPKKETITEEEAYLCMLNGRCEKCGE